MGTRIDGPLEIIHEGSGPAVRIRHDGVAGNAIQVDGGPGTFWSVGRLGNGMSVNITDFNAQGNGIFDDASAMQLAINRLGTAGGTVVVPAGTWTWKSVPLIPAGLTGMLRIVGQPGATIQLTQAGPAAFAFNRTADHQTFRNVEISDFDIDGGAGAVIGKYNVVIGNWSQGTQLRMNFDNIRVRRIRTVNVNSDGGSVVTTERPNVYFVAAQSGTAEATQNFVTRILIEDCDFSGGAHGVVIGGFNTQGNGAVGSLNTNTWCDDIYLNRVRHDTGVVAPASYFASVNFSLGAVGKYGRAVMRDCHGLNAGDPGVESDGWDYFLADNVLIEDASVSGFLWVNYDTPRAGTDQKYVWRNCEYRRTNAISGAGWLLRNSNGIALGHGTIRDSSFYQDRATEVPANALQTSGGTVAIQSLVLENFKLRHKNFTYSGGSNQQWSMIDLTNLTGTSSISIRRLKAAVSGTRSGAGHIINTILGVGGGTVYLDMSDIEWSSNVAGQANDTHWAFLLGAGYVTTLHGAVRRIKPLSISADTTPRMFYVFDTSTLTISPDFRLDDLDQTNWPGGGLIFRYQTGTQNADKVYQQGSIAFQDLTLSGTWVAFGSGFRNPGYKKLTNGMVELTGVGTAGAASSTMGVLPAGFRPAENLFFSTIGDTGGGARRVITLLIDTSGNIQVFDNGVGASNYVSLSGIHFPAGE